MISPTNDTGMAEHSGDDVVIPFAVEALDARGRIVRLGEMLDSILSRHDYPEPVARLVAEALVLTILLGSTLKFEGKFILQTQSDGPVDLLVADYSTGGSVRGYARFDPETLSEAIKKNRVAPQELLGKGFLSMTIDQGPETQRYQGVVQLDGSTLEEIADAYFRQSEQLPSNVKIAVAKQVLPSPNGAKESWRAGGMIAQFLPDSADRIRLPDLPSGNPEADEALEDITDDAWNEVTVLMSTIEPSELMDPEVTNETLLYRLFHEHGVRVFDGVQISDNCSCSREKIRGILESFTEDEIAESVEDGQIRVQCEFCSTSYEFDPDNLAATKH